MTRMEQALDPLRALERLVQQRLDERLVSQALLRGQAARPRQVLDRKPDGDRPGHRALPSGAFREKPIEGLLSVGAL